VIKNIVAPLWKTANTHVYAAIRKLQQTTFSFSLVLLFYDMNNKQPQTTVSHKHECIISFIIYFVVKEH